MTLASLTVQEFRNIESAELELSPTLNLIYGQNGSGKTSLLESISYLSSAQSFRSTSIEPLIRQGSDSFIIAGNLIQGPQRLRIGIRRSRKQVLRRINQESVQRQIELTRLLPVRVLHPDSHQLVSASPGLRRRFLDWGCFYFDPQFYSLWSSIKTQLKQRNALLKTGFQARVLDALDASFIESSLKLHRIRHTYMETLQPYLERYCRMILGDGAEIDLNYEPGWKDNLEDQLRKDRDRDRRMKRTHSGPQRAEIRIDLNGEEARQTASRGQQKLIVVVMTLAQISHFKEQTQTRGILMIDDLPSELDARHQNLLLNALGKLDQQIVITAIDPSTLDLSNWQTLKMFHVKHGRFSEVLY